MWTKPGSLKVGRLHKGKKQCNQWLHKKSRFEHIDASATWRLEWCTTVCSVLMIVTSLFNSLFRFMSSFRGVRRAAVQMPMLRGSRGWHFSVSEASDAASRVHVDLACNRPL